MQIIFDVYDWTAFLVKTMETCNAMFVSFSIPICSSGKAIAILDALEMELQDLERGASFCD